MSAFVEKGKDAIKSVSFLHKTLLPIVNRYRRRGGESERIRQYCAMAPSVIAQPMFVKVGANDGIFDDPISDILLASGKWKGLLIEPLPIYFDRLSRNFPDREKYILERIAIGAKTGKAPFYYIDEKAMNSIPGLPPWALGLGSFSRNVIMKHLDGALAPFIVECSVNVRPLSGVLEEHGIREVHLLHIDAEGYDFEVLKTIDLAKHAPAAILLEHKHLSDAPKNELLGHLRKHGYRVDDNGGDFFAIHKRSPLSRLARDWAGRARQSA
jgi:FkbM family methyltransferase